MQLRSLRIENFKNYDKVLLDFLPTINCLVGNNGAGKTNLLDAIYYLCTGKSYFNPVDQQLIKGEESYFSIRGEFERKERTEEVACILMKGRKKVIKRNEDSYDRLIDHYGEFPAIMIAPGDLELITGGSEQRRKWLDSTIALHDQAYLLALIRYDKILQQRNAELKKMAYEQKEDRQLLEVLDQMLIPLAEQIFTTRKAFIEEFMLWFREFHGQLSQENEQVDLKYESALHQHSLFSLFDSAFRKDVLLQRTSNGIHRDDLDFLLYGQSLKKYGSQGQQKTFLLALKLAQHQYTASKKAMLPLLLLDDVCERLDEQRLGILFRLVKQGSFGQVFITDSSQARLEHFLGGQSAYMVNIEKGKVIAGTGDNGTS